MAYHYRRLADSGLEGLLGEMSTQLSWNGSTLTVKGTRGGSTTRCWAARGWY
ncbi:hypothetical protein SBADM41S_11996 [Streptomyces badius]